jgi:hypothetical protein
MNDPNIEEREFKLMDNGEQFGKNVFRTFDTSPKKVWELKVGETIKMSFGGYIVERVN